MSEITSTAGLRILGYIPKCYETSRIMKALNQADGEELDKCWQAIDEVLNQFFVRTATWGLDTWETELNLAKDTTLTIDERRDRVGAKLIGYGTCDLYLIRKTAESFKDGTVYPIQDHIAAKIIIQFVGTQGIPTNIEDLKRALREIIPSHLDIEYQFKYLIWNELDAQNLTWDELDAKNLIWDDFEIGGWVGA